MLKKGYEETQRILIDENKQIKNSLIMIQNELVSLITKRISQIVSFQRK
jgi:hypothetical protein